MAIHSNAIGKTMQASTVWWERARKLAYLLGHIQQHRTVQQVLDTSFMPVVPHQFASVRFKYLRVYLMRGLSFATRRACIQAHYEFWRTIAGAGPTQSRLDGSQPLWSRCVEGTLLSIEMRPADLTVAEGECVLNFCLDDTTLAILTFTIIHGTSFGLSAERLLFIGGLQGRPGARDAIRAAARLNSDVAPFATLILAAQALATAWRLNGIVGIAASHQVSSERHRSSGGAHGAGAAPNKCYDDFWCQTGGKVLANFDGPVWGYAIPVNPETMPQAEPAGSHRTRTRRRRNLRGALYREMLATALVSFGAAPVSEHTLVVDEYDTIVGRSVAA